MVQTSFFRPLAVALFLGASSQASALEGLSTPQLSVVPNYLARAFPKGLTGQNGLECYVAAADETMRAMGKDGGWFFYDADITKMRRDSPPPEKADRQSQNARAPENPSGLKANATFLDKARYKEQRLKNAFDLVKRGNDLPVEIAWGIELEESLGDDIEDTLCVVGRAMVDSAKRSFADGKESEGIETLFDVHRMTLQLPHSSLSKFQYKGIYALHMLTLKEFDEQIPRMSLPGLSRLTMLCQQEVSTGQKGEGVLKYFAARRAFFGKMMTSWEAGTVSSTHGMYYPLKDFDPWWRELSPQNRADSINNAIREYDGINRVRIEKLSGAESGWYPRTSDMNTNPPPMASDIPARFKRFVTTVFGDWESIMFDEGLRRTQLRLIILECKAASFRHIHGRSPRQLSEFASEHERYDPFADALFRFNGDDLEALRYIDGTLRLPRGYGIYTIPSTYSATPDDPNVPPVRIGYAMPIREN